MIPRVIGLGRRFAGDDAVGPMVIDALRIAPGVKSELHEAPDPSALVDLLRTPAEVVLVDAVVGDRPPGTVELLTPEVLAATGSPAMSSHGISVPLAIELARTLAGPGPFTPRIQIVGVHIERPRGFGAVLHEAVIAAVPAAAALVLRICEIAA